MSEVEQSNRPNMSERKEYQRIVNYRQYSWYFFALCLYLFCTTFGFLVAYFVVKYLVYMKINP